MDLETLRNQVQCAALIKSMDLLPKGYVRIETGLLYPDGTAIEVFLSQRAAGENYWLSDLGQTMAWLLTMQIKPWQSKKRKTFLEDAIELFGVTQNGGALEVEVASIGLVSESILRLAQACLRASDLLLTRRAALQAAFPEQVEEVISDSDLTYEANVELIGRSGRPVKVDFLVRGARTRSAVLTLASGNSSQAHVAANEVFSRWYDLQGAEEQADQRVTLFDDSRDVYRDNDLRRLQEMSVVLGVSDPQAVREVLAA